jgi:hypothetical protein
VENVAVRETREEVKARFERALKTLTETLKQDRTILAAMLGGSLSHDEVWEKSDIDLLLIGDEKQKQRAFCLVEEGINIHAVIFPRGEFKRIIEGSLQSTFFHSFFSKSRLLYTHDESLLGLYDNIQKVGARDREMQLLRAGASVLLFMAKIEKWFKIKHDLPYTFFWIMGAVSELARIEVIASGAVTGREVIQQALRINPTFFGQVYTDLINGPKDEATLGAAINALNAYLDARTKMLFQPLLDYLAEAYGPRSMTEINEHFEKHIQQQGGMSPACEWLAEKGILTQLSMPLRLSEKSRVTVNEAAYYYDSE